LRLSRFGAAFAAVAEVVAAAVVPAVEWPPPQAARISAATMTRASERVRSL
jgi:hypothetical protein